LSSLPPAAAGGRAPVGAGLPAGFLKGRFTTLMSEQIRPFLKVEGFSKSGSTFFRRRGRLYDVINFQGSSRNGLGAAEHRFYVNIGIGSTDVDGVADDASPKPPSLADCLVRDRWADFAHGAPTEVNIRAESDPGELADDVRHWLGHALAFIAGVEGTDALVDLAIDGNGLQGMETTCAYLARIDDIERLRRYVETLRDSFGTEARWPVLEGLIADAVGRHAAVLLP
jgi:hypothetical protein